MFCKIKIGRYFVAFVNDNNKAALGSGLLCQLWSSSSPIANHDHHKTTIVFILRSFNLPAKGSWGLLLLSLPGFKTDQNSDQMPPRRSSWHVGDDDNFVVIMITIMVHETKGMKWHESGSTDLEAECFPDWLPKWVGEPDEPAGSPISKR